MWPYAHGPQALGINTGKSPMPMLQLLHVFECSSSQTHAIVVTDKEGYVLLWYILLILIDSGPLTVVVVMVSSILSNGFVMSEPL